MTEYELQEQDLASLTSMTTPDLVVDVMSKIDRLVVARKTVTRLIREAREVQAELSDRGVSMEFEALKESNAVVIPPVTPSPGLTEAIPEEFDDVSQITPREPIDNRSVTEITRESVIPPAEAGQDVQNFQQTNARSMQDAISQMMGIRY